MDHVLDLVDAATESAWGLDVGPMAACLMALRLARLLKLLRVIRLVVRSKTLWQLIHGLTTIRDTMFYTFLLLFVMLYVWAIVGFEMITKTAESMSQTFQDQVNGRWSSVPTIMLTLVSFVNLDSIS